MIYHRGVSLSEQLTDLPIGHCTKQDLCRTSRCAAKSSPEIARYHILMPTARAPTVCVATYASTKLYTKVMTRAEFLTFISAV